MTEFDKVTYGPRKAAEDVGPSVAKAAVGQTFQCISYRLDNIHKLHGGLRGTQTQVGKSLIDGRNQLRRSSADCRSMKHIE